MIEAPEIFARIYDLHGHRCPMSTLGGRLGLAVMAQPQLQKDTLRAIYHSRTCAVDGIALTTGCNENSGSMTVTTEGRHCLEIFDDAGNALVLNLNDNAMQIAGDYRRLSQELELGWDALDEEEKADRDRRRQAALDSVLPGLWQAPDSELIDIRVATAMAGVTDD